jgi:choline-sulfatase
MTLSALAEPRPNILFIMADDQAPWALGVSGYDQAVTPNMDRLARQGMRFTNAFTPTPVCSPARASIMTSRYGTELDITDWINPKVDHGVGLTKRVPTWPRMLQQAGYETALFGKWHLGMSDEQHPTRRGYDTFVGFRSGGNAPLNPVLEKNGIESQREGFIVDIVADEAIDWLRHRDRERPFAVSIHFREPHAPYLPVRNEDWSKFQNLDPDIPNPDYPGLDVKRVKRKTREYLAAVTAVDRNLGNILEALDDLRLADNTLVICTSDHGYNIGHHGIWHKGNGYWILHDNAVPPGSANVPRGQRPNMFDTSIKVPLIIRWPPVIRPGQSNSRTVSHLDWLPTIAEVCNVELPANTVVRGRSIVPLFRGESTEWDDDFYAEYSQHHNAHTHARMYRTPEWKLVRDFNNSGRDELYHLTVDPNETHNLIHDPSPHVQAAIRELDEQILAKMKEVADPQLSSALN